MFALYRKFLSYNKMFELFLKGFPSKGNVLFVLLRDGEHYTLPYKSNFRKETDQVIVFFDTI